MSADGRASDGALADGGLAAVALAVVVAAALYRGVRVAPAATVGGAVGAVVLEALLARRREAVRRLWARPTTKAAAVIGFLLAVALAVGAAPRVGLSLLGGGLVGYLALLAGAAVGAAARRRRRR